MTVLEQITEEVDGRIAVLDRELSQLRRVREAIDPPQAESRPQATRRRRRRTRKSNGRVSQDAVRAFVAERGVVTTTDVADHFQITRVTAQRKLEALGRGVQRVGKGSRTKYESKPELAAVA